MILDRKEKTKQVLQPHSRRRTYREIANEVHMSLRDISSTIKKSMEANEITLTDSQLAPEIKEHQQPQPPNTSKQSQALKLFSDDGNPLNVAIELDLPADEVHELYQDYLRLNSLHNLVQVYEDIDYNLYTLLDLYKIIETKQYVTSRNTRSRSLR
jgi:hypothetical protein